MMQVRAGGRPHFRLLLLLSVLFLVGSCSSTRDGDPLLNAWAQACPDGMCIDPSALSGFHDQALEYALSPVFVLKTQDVPEIEGVVREIIAFSASRPQDSADMQVVTERLHVLLLQYSTLSGLSHERSSRIIILILLLLSFFSLLMIGGVLLFIRQQRNLSELKRKAEL
ncbi:MAG: hypothetical protein IJU95_07025, partial [Treponema sp.]|nr:hypothetical protein [Treponema sp.]